MGCLFFWCAQQGASLRGVNPLRTRSGESLADDKGVAGDCKSEGSRYDKTRRRGIRSAYEASSWGKMAKIIKAQY